MSKKGSYLGGHSIIKIGKGKKLGKSKKNWPYKTVKPDPTSLPLNKSEKLLQLRRTIKKTNDLKS
ncbi:hypothetical protein [Candidatus Pelagibacter sp. HIMB1509]|uniref:hypothetical protein n=1 Tax=Candidatus Pelagibacter sp. HIMB1509 TaxID=3413339 RepID=UPI003F87F986